LPRRSRQPDLDARWNQRDQSADHSCAAEQFSIVGPADDPANIRRPATAPQAFKSIAEAEALFLSRPDNSGTHKKEMRIWKKAGQDAFAAQRHE
jgi:tungstate transport system substrate-binding protein